jgi:hypothetical protein
MAARPACRAAQRELRATHRLRWTRSGRETVTKHRQTTNGFRPGRLVLKNVPMFDELAIFEAYDVGGDP